MLKGQRSTWLPSSWSEREVTALELLHLWTSSKVALNSDCVQLKYGTFNKAGLKLQKIINLCGIKWTYSIVFQAMLC